MREQSFSLDTYQIESYRGYAPIERYAVGLKKGIPPVHTIKSGCYYPDAQFLITRIERSTHNAEIEFLV